MERITTKDLERRFERLNKTLGRPSKPWVENSEGRYEGQIGNFHLAQQNGHCGVHEITTDGGGVKQHGDWGTKRKVYEYLGGVLDGVTLGKGANA